MNQAPVFADIDLFATDRLLGDALRGLGAGSTLDGVAAFGRACGSADMMDLSRQANENPPRLHRLDRRGDPCDAVEYHPAWHALMARSVQAGLHVSPPEDGGRLARAAKLYLAAQAECGHLCPLTMTHASLAALRAEPALLSDWAPRVAGRTYDPSPRPWHEKAAVTLGMGMTERQGGTDVRANETRAVPDGAAWRVDGHKWFMSAPMSDAFLVLAQAPGGLTCFLLPRLRDDGSQNGLRIDRLKDKLGNRSNASAEVRFEAALARRLGPEGQGVRTIIAMVQETRLDCVVASAGLMRFGLASAIHNARHRSVFQRRLADQPLMLAVLADLALELEGAVALAFSLASAFDRAADDPDEAAFARIVTPAAKALVCKRAPDMLAECMEALGGNGYVEDFGLARAYREAPVNAIWEGSGNVMALDVLRALRKSPEAAARLFSRLAAQAGVAGRAAAGEAAALAGGPEAEPAARRITETVARLAAADALRATRPDLAALYEEARLGAGRGGGWGTASQPDARSLVARVFPD